MRRTALLNVVGLTPSLLGEATPCLSAWAKTGSMARIEEAFPAVTCTAQSTYLTGVTPERHGIVANGWYFREECEIKFWRQSNHLVKAPKIWEKARALDPTFTCANLFWWYNMYSTVDYAITPRPMYPSDGRKIPDLYTTPASLRVEIQEALGPFPLFHFWGPMTSIRSSRWIAEAARWVERRYQPTLTMVYLPHLDYNLQRLGPNDPAIQNDLREVDRLCGELIDFYRGKEAEVIVLSEYGIAPVSKPVFINRALREGGFVAVREELGRELLDPGASRAFAVADHQVAHLYVNDRTALSEVRRLLEKTEGISEILDEAGKKGAHLNHPRSGDFVAVAAVDAWFAYPYWLDDRKAPDFARTVDIHRKPGYDPAELFIDPALRIPNLQIAWTLLRRKLGFRTLMEVVPLNPGQVKGSHGRKAGAAEAGPLFVTQRKELLQKKKIDATEVESLILGHLFEDALEEKEP